MRDRRMDRLVAFPFSVGCVSQSSVAITQGHPKRAQIEPAGAAASSGGGGRLSTGKRPSISAGIQKMLKSLKRFSQLFVLDKEEEEEEEAEEVEMEIGFPTDVQHVAHIGWDGFSSMSTMKSWGRAPDCLSLPSSFSLKPFELAMAAQAGAPPPHGPLRA